METIKHVINTLFAPQYLVTLVIIGLFLFYRYRRVVTQNKLVAYSILAAPVVFFAVSTLDPNFWVQFKRPDNVPIAGMMLLVLFFTWLALKKAVQNDDRIRDGRPVAEAEPEEEEKVFIWPDLVYTELICLLLVSILLTVWSIVIPAPLEEPANPQLTPNPSKAPWYFLGLQEILVYFDPWLAGVVIPTFIVIGLMAIPYIDTNPKGNGYYTFEERRSEILLFQFGFIVLWVTLIVLGTFLRGPNWNFFGPFETWDPHKVEALKNVNLSDYYYYWLLDQPKPEAPPDADVITQLWAIFRREFVGIFLVLGYFLALPPALVIFSKFFRKMFIKMGFMRYMVMTFLLLSMGLFPIKMIARWTVNLKYFISIPEWLLNF